MKNLLFLFVLAIGFMSCEDDKSTEQIRMENEDEIQQYLTDNNLTSQVTESGLHYIISKEGNGESPTVNNDVTVHYHGYFTNGDVFDSSVDRGETSTFPLLNVILGWQEGIPLFSKGGEGVLLIPSHLAYGRAGRGSIPANSVLIFDIQLFDF